MSDVCGAGSQISGTSFLTLTGATLLPSGSCTINVTVQVPAAAGQHTSGSHTPHHFTPDDEEAFEHENFFNPDTTPHHDSHSN